MRNSLIGIAFLCLPFLFFGELTPIESSAHSNLPDASPAKAPRTDDYGDPLPDGVFYSLGTKRMRHWAGSLFFSADGKELLSASGDDLRVWNIESGMLLRQMKPDCSCQSWICSWDDRFLAGIGRAVKDGDLEVVVLLDKVTGKELNRWQPGPNWHSIAFTADSKKLVGLGTDLTVYHWDLATSKEVARQPLQKVPLRYLGGYNATWEISGDGTIAVCQDWKRNSQQGELQQSTSAAGTNRQASWRFWNCVTGKECRASEKTNSPTYKWQWSASNDMGLLAVIDPTNGVELLDATTGERDWLARLSKEINSSYPARRNELVAIDPSAQFLLWGCENEIAMYDLASRKLIWKRAGVNLEHCYPSFSSHGKQLAMSSRGQIMVLSTASGEPIGFSRKDVGQFWQSGQSPRGPQIHIPSDGRSFFVASEIEISHRALDTGKEIRQFAGAWIDTLSPDDKLVVISDIPWQSFSNHVFDKRRVINIANGKLLWHWTCQDSELTFSPESKFAAEICERYGTMVLRNAKTGRETQQLKWQSFLTTHHENRMSMCISSDLKRIMIQPLASEVWDVASNQKLQNLEIPLDFYGYRHFAFCADNSRIVGSATVRQGPDHNGESHSVTSLCDSATGKVLLTFDGSHWKTSSDSKRMLVTTNDYRQSVRDASSGRLYCTLPFFYHQVFAFESNLLVASDKDRHSVTLWETNSGKCLWTWSDPSISIYACALTPDCRTAIFVSSDGVVYVCDTTGLASAPGKLRDLQLDAADEERLWPELKSDDGPRVHKAFWSLVAAGPQAVKMLRQKLRPVERPDAKEMAALLSDLDSDRYAVREKATQTLERQEAMRPALVEALSGNPPIEVRRRIEQILAKQLDVPSDAEQLRSMRAILVLQQIGTPEARQIVQLMAGGVAESRITAEAQAALKRFK